MAAATAAATLPSYAAVRGSNLRFGYTAMTWGSAERQAIDDISSLGFSGIQFRLDALSEFKPDQLRDLLAQHKLTFVALSSGEVSLDRPAQQEVATHVAH